MLYESSRPPYLIKRIASDKGHLDNVAASYYLSNLIGSNTKEVNLAHISEECNTEEIALNTAVRLKGDFEAKLLTAEKS